MSRPDSSEYAGFYDRYISRVEETDVLSALRTELQRTCDFLRGIPTSEETVCHAPYTWTIRQVVGHMNDTERVFGFRAFWIARGDTTPMPGFDEMSFSLQAPHAHIPLAELTEEFSHLRQANLHLLQQLDASAWDRRGIANSAEITVRALAYSLVGHERHHMTIVRKRITGQV